MGRSLSQHTAGRGSDGGKRYNNTRGTSTTLVAIGSHPPPPKRFAIGHRRRRSTGQGKEINISSPTTIPERQRRNEAWPPRRRIVERTSRGAARTRTATTTTGIPDHSIPTRSAPHTLHRNVSSNLTVLHGILSLSAWRPVCARAPTRTLIIPLTI